MFIFIFLCHKRTLSYVEGMTIPPPLSPKQVEFLANCTAKWNLAHGSVSTGKTVITLLAFMHSLHDCPDSLIYMVGHSSDTIYRNAVRLLFEAPELSEFRPFCTWYSGKRQLLYRDKTIQTLGAKDEGAVGAFQGLTMSRCYCDEMTLYPDSIVDMIDSRLRKPYSKAFAAMNPSHPRHKLKAWIDLAAQGDPNYYALHFVLDDNPFLPDDYKDRIRKASSGLFYKRNVLGLWAMADGAIFDFFDRNIYVIKKPPTAAEYWIAGVDYGSVNAFGCVLIGVSTGKYTQTGKQMWVEKEYFWDSKKMEKQKTQSEYATDLQIFLEPYAVKNIYCDPSAEAFQHELRKRGMHVTDGNNDVENGISIMTSEMKKGTVLICDECPNLIREIETYVWDSKAAEKGEDRPVKKDDHLLDALRYCLVTHKVATYQPFKQNPDDYLRDRFNPRSRF
jgi:PBSX family phage terminase large subunit